MKKFYENMKETVKKMVEEIKAVDYKAIVTNVANTMMETSKKVYIAMLPVAKAVKKALVITGKVIYYTIALALMIGYGIYLVVRFFVRLYMKAQKTKTNTILMEELRTRNIVPVSEQC